MWCKQCGQDVPGLAAKEQGGFVCARCGGDLGGGAARGAGAPKAAAHGAPAGVEDHPGDPAAGDRSPSSLRLDDWELDQQLRHIERMLRTPGAAKAGAKQRPKDRARRLRLDAAHAQAPPWHSGAQQDAGRSGSSSTRDQAVGGFPWVILALGMMAFVCGGVLLGWSVAAQRPDLWNRGMPFVVGGQLALLVGLVLQIERLWRSGRHTADKLDAMDQQLHGLRHTTAMLGTTHSSPATAFYSHLAGGASPQLLLTDLKGQLDMLALRLGESEGPGVRVPKS